MTMQRNPVRYDPDADMLYVRLSNEPVAKSHALDDSRIIDYSADGGVVGVEFVNAGEGIDLNDLPFQQRVEQLIGDSGYRLRILA
jgi:uncharacterized protein YuzE